MFRKALWSIAVTASICSAANANDIHRVVTTLDANNKSTTLFDSNVPLEVGKSGNPGAVLWITDSNPAGFSQEDTGKRPIGISPPDNGTVIREDRRMAKAHMRIQMGGLTAAIEAYQSAPTPNVIILKSDERGEEILDGLDQLANYCDAGTRVVIVGRMNDVMLYRELVRRGVSDYLISPVDTLQVVRAVCGIVLGARCQAGRAHRRRGRRQGRRRGFNRGPQYRVLAGARPDAQFGGDRSRSRVRHRRPRFRPGSAAGHRRSGVFAGPHRHRLRRPPVGQVHRSFEPVGGAGDAGAGLRFRRRRVRTRSSIRCAQRCPAWCSTCRINGPAGASRP